MCQCIWCTEDFTNRTRGYTASFQQPERLVACKNRMARLQFAKYLRGKSMQAPRKKTCIGNNSPPLLLFAFCFNALVFSSLPLCCGFCMCREF